MTKLAQFLTHCQLHGGTGKLVWTYATLEQFEACRLQANAAVFEEWVKEDGADMVRRVFSRVSNEGTTTVQCLRAPTVRDWTERRQAERRKAVG